jgi:hypothetical protein
MDCSFVAVLCSAVLLTVVADAANKPNIGQFSVLQSQSNVSVERLAAKSVVAR